VAREIPELDGGLQQKKKNYCWWIFQHFPRFDYHTGGFASKLLLSQIFLIPGSAAVAPKPMLSILRGVRSRKIVIAWLEREGQSLQYPKLNFDGPFFNSEKKKKIAYLVGGIPTPLKNMSSAVGMMTFPTEWNIIKTMFQTTNQL